MELMSREVTAVRVHGSGDREEKVTHRDKLRDLKKVFFQIFVRVLITIIIVLITAIDYTYVCEEST